MEINEFIQKDAARSLSTTAELFKNHNSQDIYKSYIPTGYKKLDEVLGGGLTVGVHYLGAISSLGKSTFCLQMADYLAAHGQKVVYVSLEMKKIDLAAKLISMHTMLQSAVRSASTGLIDFNAGSFLTTAKSAHQLTSKDEVAKFTSDDWKTVETCAETVSENGRNITILESLEKPASIDDIENYIKQYIEAYKVSPVLFLDYLQILSPSKDMARCTDKQAVDYTVAKLRTISSRYNMPIIVISSFNRAGYDTPVSMQDFKETGNIEYSSDSLLGLQYKGVGEKNFDVNNAKQLYPREIELIIIKQRYGRAGDKIEYHFSTTYNYFDEVGIIQPAKKKTL